MDGLFDGRVVGCMDGWIDCMDGLMIVLMEG